MTKENWDLLQNCYMEFIDDLRFVPFDEAGNGPDVDDMIAFLSRCPD